LTGASHFPADSVERARLGTENECSPYYGYGYGAPYYNYGYDYGYPVAAYDYDYGYAPAVSVGYVSRPYWGHRRYYRAAYRPHVMGLDSEVTGQGWPT
jgi:hypothetical protein